MIVTFKYLITSITQGRTQKKHYLRVMNTASGFTESWPLAFNRALINGEKYDGIKKVEF